MHKNTCSVLDGPLVATNIAQTPDSYLAPHRGGRTPIIARPGPESTYPRIAMRSSVVPFQTRAHN
eukprot:3083913-Lingulodinium_polyedra.AAC.1